MNGRNSWVWIDYPAYNMGTWSAPMNTGDGAFLMGYFRRTFDAPANARLSLHVSADSRYILWCNGEFVGRGPAKGDVRHQFYETYDVSEHLREGKNVLAAQVVSFARVRAGGDGATNSVMTAAWLFAAEGDVCDVNGAVVDTVDSNTQWVAIPDHAYQWRARENWGTYLGMSEEFHGSSYPWGWQAIDYDDTDWKPVQEVSETLSDAEVVGYDIHVPHVLTPRTIPMLEETPSRFDGVAHIRSEQPISVDANEAARNTWRDAFTALIRNDAPVTIPAHTKLGITLWCDVLQTGFPKLTVEGGADARITATYAEALTFGENADTERNWREFKGKIEPRHAPDEGIVVGYWDEFLPGGGTETWIPIHWRTFRYIRMEVVTADEPVTFTALRYTFTAYPYVERAQFRSSDPGLARMWELSWRTARLCAHETYEDCPYYEQLQYAGDTQVQARIGYVVAGDPRLARQAIRHFDWSREASRPPQSRYPGRNPQFIPSWALIWVMLVRDYWWHTGDVEEVSERLSGMNSTLEWFARYENNDGLLEALPGWKVVDWVGGWNPHGYPPGAAGGVSILLNLQYVRALQCTVEVATACGDAYAAERWARHAERILATLRQYWWPEQSAYRDRPNGDELSELTQAWAIITGLPTDEQCEHMVRRLTSKRREGELPFAKATLYGRSYVFRALSKANQYEKAYGLFDHWRNMMATDLTTWPEEPYLARSYCHAWSATPIYELLSEVLGVTPGAAGWKRVNIRPTVWDLTWAEGSVPTPFGNVHVRWDVVGESLQLSATGPSDVPITVHMPDGSIYESVGATGLLTSALQRT